MKIFPFQLTRLSESKIMSDLVLTKSIVSLRSYSYLLFSFLVQWTKEQSGFRQKNNFADRQTLPREHTKRKLSGQGFSSIRPFLANNFYFGYLPIKKAHKYTNLLYFYLYCAQLIFSGNIGHSSRTCLSKKYIYIYKPFKKKFHMP